MQSDALREALGQVIANERKQWSRERELMESQAREVMAGLRATIVELEQTVKAMVEARLSEVKDGKSVSVEDVAPMLKELVESSVSEAVQTIPEAVKSAVDSIPAPKDGKDADPEAIRALVAEEVKTAVDALPEPEAGKSVSVDDCLPVIAEAVSRAIEEMPKPQNGKDADPEDMRAIIAEEVRSAVSEIPAPADGKSVSVEDCLPVISEAVERAIEAMPKPADGKSVSVEDCLPAINDAIERAVAAIPAPKDGKDGKMPLVREWTDEVHYEGEVRTFEGATYQATKDTAKQPPHADWHCLARAGENGKDGKTPVIRGTWTDDQEYSELDVVMLGGASFVAKQDDPGKCPGEGWQLMASQGKRGNQGPSGDIVRGAPIVAARIDDEGLLQLENGDGSVVTCDLYPLLSRL